ncbi:RNAse M5 [Caloramator quimbayensis]|uniref:Ribonuclease M5 n=1 Tax=Caloramator quimbayensis TaxID=1147123 RepID=A0A1T4WH95_9CLOT|nr:ribonuclease M5 [Caloramator quimbayensis]SKA76716.1 RNAse M5 [Caloramator quimbayensis]
MIKEIIVVEGRDDITAVKRAVDAELIATSGFGITDKTIEKIKTASQKRGVIIFTDPDYAGERIRKTISEKVPGCKHAFLPKNKATKNGDIGIENASPEDIRDALSKVKTEVSGREEFTMEDLYKYGLNGDEKASDLRDKVGAELGIGYGNAKQFLSRLNRYGITRQEYETAIKKVKGN